MQDNIDIARAANILRNADGVLITAGAGMGVDSGLPDFRGDEGFWQAYPPLAKAGIRFTEIANPAAFDADPRRAWGFYGHRCAVPRHRAALRFRLAARHGRRPVRAAARWRGRTFPCSTTRRGYTPAPKTRSGECGPGCARLTGWR